jgi:hypothetical protein
LSYIQYKRDVLQLLEEELKSTIKQAEHPFKQIENISYPNDVINAREI